jgi:hypothetical protein
LLFGYHETEGLKQRDGLRFTGKLLDDPFRFLCLPDMVLLVAEQGFSSFWRISDRTGKVTDYKSGKE